jgi:ATP-dependent phosphoenolpyruvate carboxykinase
MRLENTRGAYPLSSFIPMGGTPGVAGRPMDIVFLFFIYDAFGVLPPVRSLNSSTGRVSLRDWVHCKVARTDVGLSERAAMSSLCSGSPCPVWHFLHPGG